MAALQKNSAPVEEPTAPSAQQRKSFETISPQVRSLVVDAVLYQGNMSYAKAAATFKISRSSVGRIVREEKKRKIDVEELGETTPPPKKKRGRKSPLNTDVLIYLLLQLEENLILTLKDMVQMVKDTFGIDTSTSALDRALEKMDVTWKNVYTIPYDWNTPEVIYQRSEYLFQLQKYLNRPKVYIDESGFHLHINRTKGRALSGEKAKISTVPKGSRISLIGALNENGYVHYELFNSLGEKKRGVKADDFRSFLINLAPKLPRSSVMILDNCKIHHAELLKETWNMLKQTYGIDYLFLPTYSPFLNPIELSFNSIKTIVAGKQIYDRGELLKELNAAIATVCTKENANKWHTHCGRFYYRCALQLPFTGRILEPDVEDDEKNQTEQIQPQNLLM